MEIRKEQFDNLTPVQIIGTQRSGSNLLRVMLNQLHGVYAPHPPHILKTFTPILEFYGDLREDQNFYTIVEDICEFVDINPVPWINRHMDPGTVIKYTKERTLFSIYRKIYEINALANQAGYWFNKSMYNVFYLDLFEKHQFKPFLIHLVRDGRDVSLSFKRAIVGHKHIFHLASQWKKEQELSNYYINKYKTSKGIQIKYEDLLTQPESEIKKICRLIGMEYSNNILKYYESQDSKQTADSGEMWQNLSKPLLKHNFDKYKKGLDAKEIDIFEKVAGNTLMKYGYTLENDLNNQNVGYTSAELKSFDIINEKLKNEVLKGALKKDLMKRYAQEQFINKIYKERNIVDKVNL